MGNGLRQDVVCFRLNKSWEWELRDTGTAHGDDLRDIDYSCGLGKKSDGPCAGESHSMQRRANFGYARMVMMVEVYLMLTCRAEEREKKVRRGGVTHNQGAANWFKRGMERRAKKVSERLDGPEEQLFEGSWVDEMEENIVAPWLQVAAGRGADGELSLARAGRISAAVGSSECRRSHHQNRWDKR